MKTTPSIAPPLALKPPDNSELSAARNLAIEFGAGHHGASATLLREELAAKPVPHQGLALLEAFYYWVQSRS